jgi:hypothetical protein
MKLQPRIFLLAGLFAMLAIGSLASAQPPQSQGRHLGPPGGTIYAHNEAYRTVGTPAELPNAGKFDTIYVLGGDLANVADAAPGDMDFNGGRWEVRFIDWKGNMPHQYMNAEDIEMAAQNGELEIGDVARRFECPLIPKH